MAKQPYRLSLYSMIRHRFFALSHTMGKQFFSANLLVPLFAYLFGLESAALLKLTSYMTHGINGIIEKIVDPTSSSILTAIQKRTSDEQETIFFLIKRTLNYMATGMIVCIVVVIYILFLYSQIVDMTTLFYMIFYFLIHYCDNFFIPIERFYIACGKPEWILLNLILTIICVLGVSFYALSPFIALPCLLLSRLVTFYFLITFMRYYSKQHLI